MKILQRRLLRVAAAAGSEIMLLEEHDTVGDAPRSVVLLQKLKSFTIIFIFVIAALGLTPSPARAAIVYSYIGNVYTTILDQTPPAGTYLFTMRVTGSFSVAAPLSLPSLTDISASLLSYSFFDGRQTLDGGNSQITDFEVGVNAAGTPSRWQITVFQPFPPLVVNSNPRALIDTIFTGGSFGFDDANITDCVVNTITGECSGTTTDNARSIIAGNWSVLSPSPVPLPPAVILLGSALVTLFGFGRFGIRRRRQV